MDKDNDGKVSRDEFTGPKPRFDLLDLNGDGQLTEQEFVTPLAAKALAKKAGAAGKKAAARKDADASGESVKKPAARADATVKKTD